MKYRLSFRKNNKKVEVSFESRGERVGQTVKGVAKYLDYPVKSIITEDKYEY